MNSPYMTDIHIDSHSETAAVFTSQRNVVAKLRENPQARLVEHGVDAGVEWATFTVPAGLIIAALAPRRTPGRSPSAADSDRAARFLERLAAVQAESADSGEAAAK